MTLDFDTLLKIIQGGGTTALILGMMYIIHALMTGKLVAAHAFQREVARADRMEQIAFRLAELGERATAAGRTLADKLPKQD